jgi:gas vesicle protein
MPTGSSRPHPPDGAIPERSGKTKRRFDAQAARKNAQELAELAQKIPGQIDLVSKNVLPKDLSQQLKQIEKLAKSLRSQISP